MEGDLEPPDAGGEGPEAEAGAEEEAAPVEVTALPPSSSTGGFIVFPDVEACSREQEADLAQLRRDQASLHQRLLALFSDDVREPVPSADPSAEWRARAEELTEENRGLQTAVASLTHLSQRLREELADVYSQSQVARSEKLEIHATLVTLQMELDGARRSSEDAVRSLQAANEELTRRLQAQERRSARAAEALEAQLDAARHQCDDLHRRLAAATSAPPPPPLPPPPPRIEGPPPARAEDLAAVGRLQGEVLVLQQTIQRLIGEKAALETEAATVALSHRHALASAQQDLDRARRSWEETEAGLRGEQQRALEGLEEEREHRIAELQDARRDAEQRHRNLLALQAEYEAVRRALTEQTSGGAALRAHVAALQAELQRTEDRHNDVVKELQAQLMMAHTRLSEAERLLALPKPPPPLILDPLTLAIREVGLQEEVARLRLVATELRERLRHGAALQAEGVREMAALQHHAAARIDCLSAEVARLRAQVQLADQRAPPPPPPPTLSEGTREDVEAARREARKWRQGEEAALERLRVAEGYCASLSLQVAALQAEAARHHAAAQQPRQIPSEATEAGERVEALEADVAARGAALRAADRRQEDLRREAAAARDGERTAWAGLRRHGLDAQEATERHATVVAQLERRSALETLWWTGAVALGEDHALRLGTDLQAARAELAAAAGRTAHHVAAAARANQDAARWRAELEADRLNQRADAETLRAELADQRRTIGTLTARNRELREEGEGLREALARQGTLWERLGAELAGALGVDPSAWERSTQLTNAQEGGGAAGRVFQPMAALVRALCHELQGLRAAAAAAPAPGNDRDRLRPSPPLGPSSPRGGASLWPGLGPSPRGSPGPPEDCSQSSQHGTDASEDWPWYPPVPVPAGRSGVPAAAAHAMVVQEEEYQRRQLAAWEHHVRGTLWAGTRPNGDTLIPSSAVGPGPASGPRERAAPAGPGRRVVALFGLEIAERQWVVDVDPISGKFIEIPPAGEPGVRVVAVRGPAEREGLLPHDVITHLNGLPTASLGEFRRVATRVSPGEMALVGLRRRGLRYVVPLVTCPVDPDLFTPGARHTQRAKRRPEPRAGGPISPGLTPTPTPSRAVASATQPPPSPERPLGPHATAPIRSSLSLPLPTTPRPTSPGLPGTPAAGRQPVAAARKSSAGLANFHPIPNAAAAVAAPPQMADTSPVGVAVRPPPSPISGSPPLAGAEGVPTLALPRLSPVHVSSGRANTSPSFIPPT